MYYQTCVDAGGRDHDHFDGVSFPSPLGELGVLIIRLYNPFVSGCKAILQFENPAFPPIVHSFRANSTFCAGTKTMGFVVPKAVPNGNAYLIWCATSAKHLQPRSNTFVLRRCAGSSTCNQALVSNGSGSAVLSAANSLGTVGCISESADHTVASSTGVSTAFSATGSGSMASGSFLTHATSPTGIYSTPPGATSTESPDFAKSPPVFSSITIDTITSSITSDTVTTGTVTSADMTSTAMSINTADGFSQTSTASTPGGSFSSAALTLFSTLTIATTMIVTSCPSTEST